MSPRAARDSNQTRPAEPESVDDGSFNAAQGRLLRATRQYRGLTLQDVETATGGQFKMASVSAYERGERGIPMFRLVRLASLYKIAISDLVPDLSSGIESAPEIGAPRRAFRIVESTVARFDLSQITRLVGDDWTQVRNFIEGVQRSRRSKSGRYLTVRRGDLWALATMYSRTIDEFVAMLRDKGLLQG